MNSIPTSSFPPPVRRGPGGRVQLRTLVMIRWVAVLGQLAAVLVVQFGLGYNLPLAEALAAIGLSAAVNLWVTAQVRRRIWLTDRAAALYLAFDLVQLAVLLYLTGGLGNPFAILILAPVTVSAAVLSRYSTAALSLTAVLLVVLLAFWHRPLPWPGAGFALEPMLILALAAALVLAILLVGLYVFSVAEEARRMSHALSASYMALDREQRVSALGALAAAAAHELGSPLGTIAVIAKEIARDLPPDSPHPGDVELLLSESERCRTILTELSTRPERRRAAPAHAAGGPGRDGGGALSRRAGAPDHRRAARRLRGRPPARPPAPHSPNWCMASATCCRTPSNSPTARSASTVRWSDRRISLTIADDGPGFAPGLLDHLGEPYLSGGEQGRGTGEPMGLGVFIAQTLLARTGALLSFGNGRDGGAEVTIVGSGRVDPMPTRYDCR